MKDTSGTLLDGPQWFVLGFCAAVGPGRGPESGDAPGVDRSTAAPAQSDSETLLLALHAAHQESGD